VSISEASGAPKGRQEIARGVSPWKLEHPDKSSVRAAQREKISECRPYRAPPYNCSITRGYHPWLFPGAPLGLRRSLLGITYLSKQCTWSCLEIRHLRPRRGIEDHLNNTPLGFGIWNLGVGICLGFGILNFEFPADRQVSWSDVYCLLSSGLWSVVCGLLFVPGLEFGIWNLFGIWDFEF